MTLHAQTSRIILPDSNWQEIVSHSKRKLAGDYLPGESKIKRAYGIIAGSQNEKQLTISQVMPGKKNLRSEEPYKTYMDRNMSQHAVASKTPSTLFSARSTVAESPRASSMSLPKERKP